VRDPPACTVAVLEDVHDQLVTVTFADVMGDAVRLGPCGIAVDVDQHVVQRVHGVLEFEQMVDHPRRVTVGGAVERAAVIVDRIIVIDRAQEFGVSPVDAATVGVKRPLDVPFRDDAFPGGLLSSMASVDQSWNR
jgi:hypothetical protein